MRAWVGHVDQKVIQHYTHIADADNQAAMRLLAQQQSFSDLGKQAPK